MKTFYLCALGCPRRGIDSQKIYNYLESNGYASTHDYQNADLIVISTCAVVKDREDQSLQALKFYSDHRKENSKIVVSGCLSEIDPAAVAGYSTIDFLSPQQLDRFDEIIGADVKFSEIPEPNQIFSHPLFADLPGAEDKTAKSRRNRRLDLRYAKEELFTLRLARGCLGQCSFCAIKFAAGSLASKPLAEIITEFKTGLAQGYEIFTLVAGDTGCYGLDIGTTAVELLREIFKLPGRYRLILKEFNAQWLIKYQDALLELLENNYEKIDYMIVPVQSGSNRILRKMKRPYDIEKVKACLRIIQSKIPGLVITTHMMAGFPGETEEDFQQSIDFIKEFKFPFVDIYGYEDRPRTPSSRLDGKIPQPVIEQRVKQLRSVQEALLEKFSPAPAN